jgi:hypothetical protein
LENIRKIAVEIPRSAFKRKTKVEKGGASGSRIKKEQKGT